MAVREDVLTALRAVLPAEPGIAVIHSALSELMPPAGWRDWDILYALDRLTAQGWTVALPAFTFSFCGGAPFHWRDSASETGILADWVRQRFPLALRSPHPIYSFVVLGPRAAAIAACPSTTTFGDDSPFGWFEREGAVTVMLGCSWHYNTQFHRYEELAGVPYRHAKVFAGSADFGAGPRPTQAAMWVRHLGADPDNDFSPAVERLRAKGLIATAPLWRGRVEAVRVADTAQVCRAALAADPFAFVANAVTVRKVLAAEAEARAQPPLRLAVLGQANLHLLDQAWREDLAALLPERRLEWYELPFGQLHPALLDAGSALAGFAPAVRLFCDRLEDVAGSDWNDGTGMEQRVRSHAERIAAFHRRLGGWTIVHRFAALEPAADGETLAAQAGAVAAMNVVLSETLAGLPQIAWVDLAAEAAAHAGPVLDPRLWQAGRFPFAASFSRHLARRWSGLVLATQGKTARLVVCDLDNTLWGGVLGEDGLSGIRIGGDYPGNAFAAFQRALKGLSARGVALAISSKNDEDLALKALDELPAMVLRDADFSARRINWQPKWRNIADIAAELNLGLDSVLFVDDNPVEREAVRRNLPGVKVLELPDDPALYVRALLDSPYVAATAVTAEDRQRVADFKARQVRAAEREQAASLEDYYASLGMTLHLAPLAAGNAQRAAQLVQKTNQFNTTTRRHDLAALERMAAEGWDVVVIGLEDRHSPFENIGLLLLKPEADGTGTVDLYLLSCRVLGRGIETQVLRWAMGRAARRGWNALTGEIIDSERNTPVRAVFAEAGFAAAGPGRWTISTQAPPALPGWLNILDRFSDR